MKTDQVVYRLTFFLFAIFLIGCKPDAESAYENSFVLRAARELDAIGDDTGARYYLERALADTEAKMEAKAFLAKIAERRVRAPYCIEEKKTDLIINQYPRIRHKHLFQMAVCLEAGGDHQKALGMYNLSENSGGKQPQLYLRRGFLKEKLGDREGAGTDFRKAVALNAEYPPAQMALALFELRTGLGNAPKTLDLIRSRKPLYAEIIEDMQKNYIKEGKYVKK